MTSSGSKRASWPLAIAVVLAGLCALGGGAFAAFAQLSRKEREVVATHQLERDSQLLRERLEGSDPALAAALARLGVGEVDSSALAKLVREDVEDAAVVRLGSPTDVVAWAHEPEGRLAALFRRRAAGEPDPSPHGAIMNKVGDLKGTVSTYQGLFPYETVVVEQDSLQREVVGVVYLASPSPVLLLELVRQSAHIPTAFEHLVGSRQRRADAH